MAQNYTPSWGANFEIFAMVHDTFGKPDMIRFGSFGKMSLFISRFGLVGSVWHEGFVL